MPNAAAPIRTAPTTPSRPSSSMKLWAVNAGFACAQQSAAITLASRASSSGSTLTPCASASDTALRPICASMTSRMASGMMSGRTRYVPSLRFSRCVTCERNRAGSSSANFGGGARWQSVVISGRSLTVFLLVRRPTVALARGRDLRPDHQRRARPIDVDIVCHARQQSCEASLGGPMSVVKNQEIADQWVDGLTGNWSVLETLSSPTMRVWHSHDNQWLTREEGAARMAESGTADQSPSFQDIRVTPTTHGFVLQGWADGLAGVKTHIVQICTVEKGKVASCEEYIAPEMNIGG